MLPSVFRKKPISADSGKPQFSERRSTFVRRLAVSNGTPGAGTSETDGRRCRQKRRLIIQSVPMLRHQNTMITNINTVGRQGSRTLPSGLDGGNVAARWSNRVRPG